MVARTGTAHHYAKLNPETVHEMRRLYAQGGTSVIEVSNLFDVAVSTARSALTGDTWKSVPAVIVKDCPTCHGTGKVPQ